MKQEGYSAADWDVILYIEDVDLNAEKMHFAFSKIGHPLH